MFWQHKRIQIFDSEPKPPLPKKAIGHHMVKHIPALQHNYERYPFASTTICSYLVHFLSPSSKNKKSPPRKKFLIFRETELSSSNIKKNLVFSQKKAFLISREMETPKKIPYISRNVSPKKMLIFQEVIFRARKMKKFHSEKTATLFYSQVFFTLHSFPHLPKYRECYRFERAFLTLRRFLPYTPSNIWHNLLLSRLP